MPVLLNLSFFSGDRTGRQRRGGDEAPFDPIAEVLARGWAFAQMGYGDIQPDRVNQWQKGVIGLALKDGQTRMALHR